MILAESVLVPYSISESEIQALECTSNTSGGAKITFHFLGCWGLIYFTKNVKRIFAVIRSPFGTQEKKWHFFHASGLSFFWELP